MVANDNNFEGRSTFEPGQRKSTMVFDLTNLGQFSQENIISYYGAAGISKWMGLRKVGGKHFDDCANG